MPAKNCLSLSEKKNLQEALKTEENYKVRERMKKRKIKYNGSLEI